MKTWEAHAPGAPSVPTCMKKVISIFAIPGLFTQTPVSVNSTPSATVHFACSVERGIPLWYIDGLALWQLPSPESFHFNNTAVQDEGIVHHCTFLHQKYTTIP